MIDDLALAVRAALAGAGVGLEYFERVRHLSQDRKADGSIVTEADLAVETEVRRVLLEARPDDAFLGEETGVLGRGRRRWILDGIDGTLVFVRGDDRWQSLIALEVDGEVTVGVAVVPAQHRIWYAAKGRGAFTADLRGGRVTGERRLRVAAGDGWARTGLLPPVELLPPSTRAPLERLAGAVDVRDWSVHAALLVAGGELDLAVQVGGKVWDYAPLSLIVQEAGGRFAGADGQGHPVTGTAVWARDEATLNRAWRLLDSA